MTNEHISTDWRKLVEAAAHEIDRCEFALRVVLPFFRKRVSVAEQDELELTILLLRSLRRKFTPRANVKGTGQDVPPESQRAS